MLEEKVKAKIMELIALHPRGSELTTEQYEFRVNEFSRQIISACRAATATDDMILASLDKLKLSDDLNGVGMGGRL